MNWFEALIMGLVQGLAEYLPVSSSGQLEICHQLLGLDTSGAESLQFDVTLHVATVLSTIAVLWREFSGICTSVLSWRRDNNFRLFWKIVVSCIPVAIVGVCLKDVVEEAFGGNLTVVGVCQLATAALLLFAYFGRTRRPGAGYGGAGGVIPASAGRSITWVDAFIIGIAQAVAVLPGLSRSGSTIATGILLGNKRDQLAQFSFLMVIIPVLGVALLDILKAVKGAGDAPGTEVGGVGLVPLAVGFLASFIVGCLACRWMIELVKRGRMVWFAVYCIATGVLCLIFK